MCVYMFVYIYICTCIHMYIYMHIYISAISKFKEMQAITTAMEFMPDFAFHILAFLHAPTSKDGMKELRTGLRWMAERRSAELGEGAPAIPDRILRVWPSYCHAKFYQAGHGKKVSLHLFRHAFFGLHICIYMSICIFTHTTFVCICNMCIYIYICRRTQ